MIAQPPLTTGPLRWPATNESALFCSVPAKHSVECTDPYFLTIVTEAVAVLVGSGAAVALTVTVDGDGTVFGALYEPDWLIVPTVPLPPTVPFTFQVADVFVVPWIVAVNCRPWRTRTVAVTGEIAIETGRGATTFTKTVFETSPSGVVTLTGTDDFGAGALPVAVNAIGDTKFVASSAPSNDTIEPATNPAPSTVSVKLPAVTGDGLTDVMLACGMIVAIAVPLDVGDATLVARIVTDGGEGTTVGGRY